MNKKIIFYIPSIEGGGVEKNLFLLIKHLSKKIDRIYIITANKKKNNSKKIKYICPNSHYWEKKSVIKKYDLYLFINKNFCLSKAIIFFSIKHNFNNNI